METRIRLDIDHGNAYIEKYQHKKSENVILFIHGIFGEFEETWDTFPIRLMSDPTFHQTDIGSFGYEGKIIDGKPIEITTDQLRLWFRTHLCDYKRIFIIAHSMGGLITRQLCIRLIESDISIDREIYEKIRHCIHIAVPLSGSSTAKKLNFWPISSINQKVKFLDTPTIDGENLSNKFRDAILFAKNLKLKRPKYSLFIGLNDKLVSEPDLSDLSCDDIYEGPVPGDHANLKNKTTSNSTIYIRTVQIFKEYLSTTTNSQGDTSITKERWIEPTSIVVDTDFNTTKPFIRDTKTKDVILLPCSKTKVCENLQYYPTDMRNQPSSHFCIDKNILAKRFEIFSDIKGGVLLGTEYNEGDRGRNRLNKNLVYGFDFGGFSRGRNYLPAYQCYDGRCFQPQNDEWQDFFKLDKSSRPEILIVSGLYGLLSAQDFIQGYDCHFTDEMKTSKREKLNSRWSNILTNALMDHLQWLTNKGYHIGRIFNLLTEASYNSALNWTSLQMQFPTMHIQFNNVSGRDALDDIGAFFNEIIINPEKLIEFETNIKYQDNHLPNADFYYFSDNYESANIELIQADEIKSQSFITE